MEHSTDQHERIAQRAHQLWVERGQPLGTPEVDWSRAEQELAEPEGHFTKAASEAGKAIGSAIGSMVGKVAAILSEVEQGLKK